MDNTEYIIQLADHITGILDGGFVLNDETLHFIYSYFSISTADELETQLKDENFDREMLYELVVSPDEDFQVKLEHIIETGQFSKTDHDKILKRILSTASATRIIFPENNAAVRIPVTGDIMNRFVSKLRVNHNIPEKLIDIINTTLPEDLINTSKVKLRNSNLDFNNKTIHFFSLLIEKAGVLIHDYLPCLEFSLSVLENSKTPKGLMKLFQEKKVFYTHARNTIRQVEELLKSSTMETVMLQGISVPSVSMEEIGRKIYLTDTILFLVFGFIDRKENTLDLDLGEFSTDEDIQKMFRLFS